MNRIYILWLATTLCIIGGCTNDSEELLLNHNNCDTTNVKYNSQIVPILANNCLGCHSSAVAEGDIVLDEFENVHELANNGRLLGAIEHADGYTPMPLDQEQLTECERAIIRNWIEQGSKNN